jgi:hypothetical protein
MEGPAYPAPTKKFSRIPFANIQAAMDKLIVQDGFFPVFCKDERHTAQRLNNFLKTFSQVEVNNGKLPDTVLIKNDDAITGGDDSTTKGNDATAKGDDVSAIELLKQPIIISETNQVIDTWSKLINISLVVSTVLVATCSIYEMACGEVNLSELKMPSGRAINKKVIAALTNIDSQGVRMLSGIKSISPATATEIMKKYITISNLCSTPDETIALIEIPQKSRTIKLGMVKAKKIKSILMYKREP